MKKRRGALVLFLLVALVLFTGCYLKNKSWDVLQGLREKYNEKFIIVEHPEKRSDSFKISPKKNPEIVFEARYEFSGDGTVIPKLKNRLFDNYSTILLENHLKQLQIDYPELRFSINGGSRLLIKINSYEDIIQAYDVLQSFDEGGLPSNPPDLEDKLFLQALNGPTPANL